MIFLRFSALLLLTLSVMAFAGHDEPLLSLFPNNGALVSPGILKMKATFFAETVKKAKIELWRKDSQGKKGKKQKLNMAMEDEKTNLFSVLSQQSLGAGTYCHVLDVEFETGTVKMFKSDIFCFLVVESDAETQTKTSSMPLENLSNTENPPKTPSMAESTGKPLPPISSVPMVFPSQHPSKSPTVQPSGIPTMFPVQTNAPVPSTDSPSSTPSVEPSSRPSPFPSVALLMTTHPSATTTDKPSSTPLADPSAAPSSLPSTSPLLSLTSTSIMLSQNNILTFSLLSESPSKSPKVESQNTKQISEVTLEVKWEADGFPNEFTFQVTDDRGNIVLEKLRSETTETFKRSQLESGRVYCFRGTDDYGDGICCSEGNGGFEIMINGNRILKGGLFRFSTGYHCFTVDEAGKETFVEPKHTQLCEKNDPNNFNICVEIVDVSKGILEKRGLEDAFSNVFLNAKKTWAGVILEDDGNDHDVFGYPVDDLYIEAAAALIDGTGSNNVNVMGFAGPGLTWTDDQGFMKPFTGYIAIDVADMQKMVNGNKLNNVVDHEMAHVLGLGTLWKENGLYEENGKYTGDHANQAYRKVLKESGATFNISDATVPIEEEGGKGTIYVHWDELCLKHEIMTGRIDSVNIFSNITLGGLHDLGYRVNYAMAKTYIIPDIMDCIPSRRRLRGATMRRRQWKQHHGRPVDSLHPQQVEAVEKAGQNFLQQRKRKGHMPRGVRDFGSAVVDVLFADDDDNIFSLFVHGEDS